VEGRPLDEADLIERARGGDAAAYEELVVTHQAIAFRTAYLVTGNAADAEDAAQAGLIKAFYALNGFKPGHPFRPWLLKIVANEARNRRRSAGRRTGLELRLAEGRPRDDAAPSPEEAALDRERDERLLAALQTLREEDRLVVGYRFFLGLSEAEIAAAMSCAQGTVKSRLSRALVRLRKELERSAVGREVPHA
jgi:RNA polymerase sigma factor (sigma-70 family)